MELFEFCENDREKQRGEMLNKKKKLFCKSQTIFKTIANILTCNDW